MKKLFLASEAKSNIEQMEEFVGGFKNKSIAFIPTAANGEHAYEEWKTESATWKIVQALSNDVEAIQLEDYRGPSVIDKLKNKDILWLAGGIPAYLMYWIIRCELDKALPQLLERSVYVGSSASSMICSKTLKLAAVYPRENDRNGHYLPGLGYLDFEIYPHYQDELLPEIKKHWKNEDGDLHLLKNGEYITIVDGKIEFFGENRVLRNGELI